MFVKDVDLEAMPTSIFLNDDNDDDDDDEIGCRSCADVVNIMTLSRPTIIEPMPTCHVIHFYKLYIT